MMGGLRHYLQKKLADMETTTEPEHPPITGIESYDEEVAPAVETAVREHPVTWEDLADAINAACISPSTPNEEIVEWLAVYSRAGVTGTQAGVWFAKALMWLRRQEELSGGEVETECSPTFGELVREFTAKGAQFHDPPEYVAVLAELVGDE